jgi:hypothetical protein
MYEEYSQTPKKLAILASFFTQLFKNYYYSKKSRYTKHLIGTNCNKITMPGYISAASLLVLIMLYDPARCLKLKMIQLMVEISKNP